MNTRTNAANAAALTPADMNAATTGRLLADHVPKIARVLAQLDIATDPDDMDLPGFHLHPLTGNLAGFWSVTIRANWRIIFRFDAHGDATDIDYVDYH